MSQANLLTLVIVVGRVISIFNLKLVSELFTERSGPACLYCLLALEL